MPTLALDNIGLLATNDPAIGEGPLGLVRDAALVFDGDRVAAVERAGASADRRIEVGSRCVIPGFVDSHTHLVFAGDRSDEFAARTASRPYEAGGIRVTTAATGRRSPTSSPSSPHAAAARRCGPESRTSRSSPGPRRPDRAACCEVAAEHTDDVTFLGAHVVPEEYEGRADDYVALVLRRDARRVRATRAVDRRVL